MAITPAATTKDLRMVYRDSAHIVGGKATANTTIYAGTLVNRTSSTGLLVDGGDTASTTFAGVSRTHIIAVNDGATPIVELFQSGDFLFKLNSGTIDEGDVGTEVEVADNNSFDVAGATSNHVKCGKIVEFADSTHAYIRIDGYAF